MATSQKTNEPKIALEIRTKSVEQTLIPLVTQITTLVNAKDKPVKSEKTLRALVRVGQAVSLAVERFVTVGESIAEENAEIQLEMNEACSEARVAGIQIQKLTDVKVEEVQLLRSVAEKTAMVRAARQLLSAITKVLILADKVVVKQVIAARNKVNNSLKRIEACSTFADFVQHFSQFGNEMVDLAHVSGERQNDLKSDKARAQIGAARSVLEKSTMMLLTTSKALLRHSDCSAARQNRDLVLTYMRKALDQIYQVVQDAGPTSGDISPSVMTATNGDSGISLAQHQPTAFRAIKEFEDLVETTRMTLVNQSNENKLDSAVETVIETTQDFTDSAYTSHENRERIISTCQKLKHQVITLVEIGKMLDKPSQNSQTSSQDMENAILKTREASRCLRKQLQDTTMDQASDVFKTNADHELLTSFKQAGLQGNEANVSELAGKFQEHAEQIQEVCKLLRHISGTEALIVWAEHAENITKTFTPQIIHAASVLSKYSASKIAKENMDVFTESWATHINDLSILVKDINDVCQGKVDKTVYMSLPRPGQGIHTASVGHNHHFDEVDDDDVFLSSSPSPGLSSPDTIDWFNLSRNLSNSGSNYGNSNNSNNNYPVMVGHEKRFTNAYNNAYNNARIHIKTSDTNVAGDGYYKHVDMDIVQGVTSRSCIDKPNKVINVQDVKFYNNRFDSEINGNKLKKTEVDDDSGSSTSSGEENDDDYNDGYYYENLGQIRQLGISSLAKVKVEEKHGTTAKNLRASKLNTEEQAKIAKLGLEMKLITSEMDAETEKWGDDTNNEIICRGKNMSSMAFSMYLFTRGEGPLKTTQDLFTQAQYFAEEGVRLFQCCKDFSSQVPQSAQKVELLSSLECVPTLCQRLTVTIKSPTVGKTATFTKVDSVVQETKNLMNCVAKVVTTCLVCASKYGIDYQSRVHHSQWRPLQFDISTTGGPSSDGSDRDSVKSAKSLGAAAAGGVPGKGDNNGSSGVTGKRGGSEPVRRSASLNSRPPPGAHPMQYMSDRL